MGTDTSGETMGEKDSCRQRFPLWVGNTQLTKVRGRDHRGEFRIGGRE